MRYKKLGYFLDIFERSDYNHIADMNVINQVSEIILYKLPEPDDFGYIKTLKMFSRNLGSFIGWLGGDIKHLRGGYSRCNKILLRAISLFQEPAERRGKISKGYLRKFNKTFLYGLSEIQKGVRNAFDYKMIGGTNITAEQFVRFIIDKRVGLADRFYFNIAGRNAFFRKLPALNKQELIVAMRLLIRPSLNQVRTFNGWTDLGIRHSPIRILAQRSAFRKAKIFFIFTLAEHRDYEKQLAIPPAKAHFSEF